MEAIMDAQGVWEAVEPAAGAVVDEKKNKTRDANLPEPDGEPGSPDPDGDGENPENRGRVYPV